MDAIGGNHRLETAVADLVDNAIDAGSSNVLIRFVVVDGDVASFYVVDDGRGMTADEIDAAMTVGGRRDYAPAELGHFGMGLKAASFSQADSLTVISRSPSNAAVGRRWLASTASRSFECDIVGDEFCERELDRPWTLVKPAAGTVIRWDAIRSFPRSRDTAVTSRFLLDATTKLQQHLGMVFHRFLERGHLVIAVDVEDVSLLGTGPLRLVTPLNPFGYMRTGATGYPKRLRSEFGTGSFDVDCHVWPGRSQLPQFRLPGSDAERYQGFYFYRHDRLLQAGGWNNVEVARRELQLARVAVDLSDEVLASRAFRMNPEKSRVEVGHDFADAIARAVSDDGFTFHMYLDDAERSFKTANRRSRSRLRTVPLGKGLPPQLRRAVADEVDTVPGYEPVDIRWRPLFDDVFFEVDRESGTLWLNSRYRRVVVGDYGSLNDAPLVKLLLFMLVQELFHGAHWGPKDKGNLDLWQTLLTAAVKELK